MTADGRAPTAEDVRWLSPIRQLRWNRPRVLVDNQPHFVCLEARGGCGRVLHLCHFLRGKHGLIPLMTCNRCRGVIVRSEKCPECEAVVPDQASWNRVEVCCTTCVPNV